MKHAADYIRTDNDNGEGFELINPWTHQSVGYMTWADILAWARDHIADADRHEWRKAAAKADAATLGAMILGS